MSIMINESQGQISIEIVLVIGFMLILTLGIVQYIGPATEQDKVISVAKMGFMDASNDIAYNAGNTIRFNNMTFNNGLITLTVYSKKNLADSDKNYIKSKMLNNIAQALKTTVNDDKVQGRYSYSINLVNIT